ncbi:sulfotransferase domain-containing protein [Sphingomonas sp. BAUL-RG-20F-R05-02]|uniref:sulfotransferase domain-containing protein n=1 Tax=Sphingomonas sp. BAUL-RG-20F-R05-02 TaxID=2914830 RepID=UPI001F5718E6|nr:sulfotransferase domain-containing protein [Sphingomonas sp. BAUL-RG-20F-R05-02]
MDYSSIIKMPIPGAGTESFVFSVHKAGSSLLFGMLEHIFERCEIPAISIPDILFLEGVLDDIWQADDDIQPMFMPGCVYFGFRSFPAVLKNYARLGGVPKVFLIRDPRDMLTSQYFAFGGKHFSHKLPNKNADSLVDYHMRDKHMEIDEYVIKHAEFLHAKLYDYREHVFDENLLMLRYEDIFFDKAHFLESVLTHIGVIIDNDIIKQIAAAHDIRPVSEDPTRHIRRGTPGDHAKKLQPATIEKLTTMFRDLMGDFGYRL